MKIQFTKPAIPLGYAYSDGDEVDVNKAFGKEMVNLGYAVELEEGDTDIPSNFPGRKILEANGILTMAEVKKIATIEHLAELKGIGKKTAEEIVAFFAVKE
jgi:ERCC4-type nuclease